MIKKYFLLFLFIPFNIVNAALLEEKLVIDKEKMTPSSKNVVVYHNVETTQVKKSLTSPYQSLSPGDTSLLKPISKIEEEIKEKPKVHFQIIIPYKIRLKFDEELYHDIQREIEKVARLEKRQLEERRRKIVLEKQRLEEEEEKRIKELKIKIETEEKERFEEKMGLIEEEIEEELSRRKAKQEEEKRIKQLAAKKLEEEKRREIEEKKMIEREKYIKAQEEKKKTLELERKEKLEAEQRAQQERITEQKKKEEEERLAKQKREAEKLREKEIKEAKKKKQEEKKRKEEEERQKLAEYQELDLDKVLDRELPLGSKLNIDGTKVIDIKMGNSDYLDSKRRKNKEKPASGFTSGIDIHQELTVKLHGVVKEKIHVQVDYSDIDHNKKQNFYINYQGDNKEVIQKVEFGDVKFTAPGTEFVGYNRQVFGVSAEAKVGNNVKLWGIASRSKGIRVTKEFKGDKRIVNINRADTTYTSQKYYYLVPDEIGNIRTPITLEAVYIDDKNGNNNNPPKYIGKATAKISIPGLGSNTYTGFFDIQYEGTDYVFDSNTQILTFKQNVSRDYIVGVVFKDSTGNYFPPEYSRDKNNPGTILMIEPGVALVEYDVFEMRNHYGIGENIPTDTELKLEIIDNGGLDFFDKPPYNNKKDTDEYYYLQIFGLDTNGDGRVDNDKNNDCIDHDTGIIKFPDITPFNIIGTETNPFLNTHMNELKDYLDTLSVSYHPSDDYSKQHKYTIKGTYTTKVKSYMLGYLNIVEGSEQVYVDGKLLTRDTDYFIDYDTGFLSFMQHVNITEYTTIKIDYEYTPFIGTRYQKTVAGLRGEFNPNSNFSIGSTYLYEGAPKLKKIPNVSDPMLGNLQVIDVNTSIKLTNMLKNLFNLDNNIPVDMTISGEVAKSYKNENTFGSAIIDSMEGVEEARKISMDENSWQLGSLPEPEKGAKRGKLLYCKKSDGSLITSAPPYRPLSEISGPYDYEENVKWEEDDTIDENVLRLYYTDFGTDSWISIVQPLSNIPLDFSDYTHLEVWFRDNDFDKIDELYIDLGEVSEHADGTGTIPREPKTEDTSPKDYILNKGEDVGWPFKYPDGISTKIGADNNQLDTEDLNGDGVLSTKEEYFVLKVKEFKQKVKIRNQIGNWQLWSIPLSQAQIGTGTPRWSAITHIRLRFKGTHTSTNEGEICIGGIEIIGSSRWAIGTVTPPQVGTFNISSKNAEDDFYNSIRDSADYKDLYPDEDMKREETLVLTYQLGTATQECPTTTITPTKGYTYRTFYTQQNYNKYKYLKFWLYSENKAGKFFIRFGLDENNYFGYTLPIDFSGWKLISIDLDDFKNKLIQLIEEGKRTGTKTPPYNYAQLPFGYEAKNNPNFENIKWISVGVENHSKIQP
ncbi:MAG: carbohydrate binding domain-containing protein, partial [bacterium]